MQKGKVTWGRIALGMGRRGYLDWLPDKLYLRILYRAKLGYPLNLKNPKRYTEKLNWLKLYNRNDQYTKLVDKYEVRKHVAETVGEEYLIPLLGCYSSFEEIDFEQLPDQFVLKCTHGSHCSIFCNDKSKFDRILAQKKFVKWMNHNWYYYAREWPYKNVKPRIICESFLSVNGRVPEDYKVYCFHGVPKFIEIVYDRFETAKFHYYTPEWKPFDLNVQDAVKSALPKPDCLDEMMVQSAKLTTDLPHGRVDWYIIHNKLYFGEITFFSAAGLMQFGEIEQELTIGSWLNLG